MKTELTLKYVIRLIVIVVVSLSTTGCFYKLFSNKNYAWFNHKYSFKSDRYWNALKSNKEYCGERSYKEGIRIGGVTYYDRASAQEAHRAYQISQGYTYPRPIPPHQGQYDYFNNRYDRCMSEKGWAWAEVRPPK